MLGRLESLETLDVVLPIRLLPMRLLPVRSVLVLATVKPLSDAERVEEPRRPGGRRCCSMEPPPAARNVGTPTELPLGWRQAVELELPLFPLPKRRSATGVSHGCRDSTSCSAGEPSFACILTQPPENSRRVSVTPFVFVTSVISNALMTVPAARLPFFFELDSRLCRTTSLESAR